MATSLRKSRPTDDFFTDSLLEDSQDSRIPTPSPHKHNKSKSTFSHHRRAVGNTRTFRGAFNATARIRRNSDTENERRASPENRRPIPPVRAETVAHPYGFYNTLSDGPLLSPRPSPKHDFSSPPRGLNDVYQRIEEEEKLNSESMDAEDLEFLREHGRGSAEDRALLNRLRNSQSPINLRSSNRSTPRPGSRLSQAEKENQPEPPGATQSQDPTGGSINSFLNELTDQELAMKLTPISSDRARLDRAINKPVPIAFSKAQVGSRHAGESGRGSRSSLRDQQSSHNSSEGSVQSDSTPPPNVPRTWGSKAKVERHWMRKYHERNGGAESSPINGRNEESSMPDWEAAGDADKPLPSVEQHRRSRGAGSNDLGRHRVNSVNSSPADAKKQWGFTDLTETNMSMSNSPPVKVRTVKHRPSIENLEKRAVTTSRLVEMRKKESKEVLAGEEDSAIDDALDSQVHQSVETTDGQQIPDTPIMVYKNSTSEDDSGAHPSQPDTSDSQDNLKTLARSFSQSRRKSSNAEPWSMVQKEDADIAASQESINKNKTSDREAEQRLASFKPALEKPSNAAQVLATPVVTGAWNDTILPDTEKTAKAAPPTYGKTPRVTGGWIDTPLVQKLRQASSLAPEVLFGKRADDKVEDEKKEEVASAPPNVSDSSPDLPRSALSNLLSLAKKKRESDEDIGDQKRDADTINLGDATIASLEDLVTLDNADADFTNLIRMAAELEAREEMAGDSRPLSGTQAEKKPGFSTEAQLLDRLGSKLDRVRTNIHDARRGISKLESQVSHPNGQSSLQLAYNPTIDAPCQSCGCPGGPSSTESQGLLQQLPRVYYSAKPNQYLLRPTLFGWMLVSFWCWYFLELYLYSLFFPYLRGYWWPDAWYEEEKGNWLLDRMWEYNDLMGWGRMVLIFFGVVINMTIDQSLNAGAWLAESFGPVTVLATAIWRLMIMGFGLGDGFVEAPLETTRAVKTAVETVIAAAGAAMGMDADEYL